MNIVTTEFSPNVQPPYHGRDNIPPADVNSENSFKWPHGISDRISLTTTTNNYGVTTERTTSTGTSADSSQRFDFRYLSEQYRYPYETPPSSKLEDSAISLQHQQQDQPSLRYDSYGNQYTKNEDRNPNLPNTPAFFKKEQPSNEMNLPYPESRMYVGSNQPSTTGLSLPPPPMPPISSTPQQTFDPRYTAALSNFQTPPFPTTKQEGRISYDEDANSRSRNYIPNFEEHFQNSMQGSSRQQQQPVGPTISLPNNVDNTKPSLYHDNMPENQQPQQLYKKEVKENANEQSASPGTSAKPEVKPTPTTKQESTPSKGNETNNDNEKTESPSGQQDNGLPSYTAMIAQAILKKESSKSTLSDIYEFMEKHFPSLEKRGTGWRNCVRHTLSLNDCFIKLHRPENGRSCNWAIHPTYYESFSRGDYRKRRALRKRPRGLQWIDPAMLAGYPFAREHDMYPDMHQQSPFYHYPPPPPPPPSNSIHPSSPQSYYHSATNFSQPYSLTSGQLQQTPPNMQHYSNHQNYPHSTTAHHMQSTHCTNPDCYCQYPKQSTNRVYTP